MIDFDDRYALEKRCTQHLIVRNKRNDCKKNQNPRICLNVDK